MVKDALAVADVRFTAGSGPAARARSGTGCGNGPAHRTHSRRSSSPRKAAPGLARRPSCRSSARRAHWNTSAPSRETLLLRQLRKHRSPVRHRRSCSNIPACEEGPGEVFELADGVGDGEEPPGVGRAAHSDEIDHPFRLKPIFRRKPVIDYDVRRTRVRFERRTRKTRAIGLRSRGVRRGRRP